MHAYTLTGATQLVYRHRIVERKAALDVPPGYPHAHLRTGQAHFNGNMRPNTSVVLKTLSSGELYSRARIAKDAELSKNAVRHEVEKLVQEGRIRKTESGNMYLYSLPTTIPNPIRRSPHFWWKRCPSCDADRKLRRMASGNYEHWCRCGHFQVISKEMVK